ncbi:hypothetical protein [Aquicoccus sp. SU-CL01552]|uniref:LEM-3-like GIY-YIG domain-containing protein n=1 Tax=Aquicoccus sp. SU-CL01552 TaxID=3127656 RepID=UPI003103DF11
MKNQEDAQLFDDLVANQLRHYVYALFDPATGQPFYVGKGGGRRGAGNRRIFDHFDEARGDRGTEKEKISKIRDIWKTDGDVPWKIVRSGLSSEEEALVIESALIDMLREMKIPLTNKKSGHGSAESGMKSRAELRAWCAPKLNLSDLPNDVLNRPIFIFNIAKGVAHRRNKFPDDCPKLYEEATCQYWNVTQHYRSLAGAMAIGCINGITRAAVSIADWKHKSDKRWEIIPNHSTDGKHSRDSLTFKNISAITNQLGYWQHGGFLVVRIESASLVTVLRGSRHRTIFLPTNTR